MAKCETCGTRLEMTFLAKILGTYIKDKKGKKHSICFACQKKFNNDKALILSKIK